VGGTAEDNLPDYSLPPSSVFLAGLDCGFQHGRIAWNYGTRRTAILANAPLGNRAVFFYRSTSRTAQWWKLLANEFPCPQWALRLYFAWPRAAEIENQGFNDAKIVTP